MKEQRIVFATAPRKAKLKKHISIWAGYVEETVVALHYQIFNLVE
jgi:hypothetical protein